MSWFCQRVQLASANQQIMINVFDYSQLVSQLHFISLFKNLSNVHALIPRFGKELNSLQFLVPDLCHPDPLLQRSTTQFSPPPRSALVASNLICVHLYSYCMGIVMHSYKKTNALTLSNIFQPTHYLVSMVTCNGSTQTYG